MSDHPQTMKEQLQNLKITPKLSPLSNGKYKLPDNTILKVREGKYEHIGHRDKKTQRELMRKNPADLKRLLQLPGFGGYKPEHLDKLNQIELANLLNPKPRCFFVFQWLSNPTDGKAKRIASLIRKAVSFEGRDHDN